jgi:hypothetical protein
MIKVSENQLEQLNQNGEYITKCYENGDLDQIEELYKSIGIKI